MSEQPSLSTEKSRLWFADARFGMFIHWGLYSIPAIGEWTLLNQRTPLKEYMKLADRFVPKKFDARAWARLAREAGAQYVVFTTRHHDGYSLYDSQVSDFTSVKRAARRDFVAEYVEAVRAEGLKVGLYYSLADWRYPTHSNGKLIPEANDYLKGYVHAQVRELLTNYGKIDLLWFDGPFGYDERGIIWELYSEPNNPNFEWPRWEGEALLAMARQLQPGIVINDRANVAGDYTTPEQHIKAEGPGRLWEACMTLNNNWGYHKHDTHWKPTWQLIANLVQCAAGGGAYLLNIGPKPDGTVPAASMQRMREIGRWLGDFGEAIFGTERTDIRKDRCSFKDFTAKGNTRYMFEPDWPGKISRIHNFPYEVVGAQLLKSGREVQFKQEAGGIVTFSGMPEKPENALMNVIRIEIRQ